MFHEACDRVEERFNECMPLRHIETLYCSFFPNRFCLIQAHYSSLPDRSPSSSSPSTPIKLKSLMTLKAHDKDINALDVAPNGKFVATGSQDKTAKVFEVGVGVVRLQYSGLLFLYIIPFSGCERSCPYRHAEGPQTRCLDCQVFSR
jgi:WD40 repeat protein